MQVMYLFGEISTECKNNWQPSESDDPLELFTGKPQVLDGDYLLSVVWGAAERILKEKIRFDWGTIAYRGCMNDFAKFFDEIGYDEGKAMLHPEMDYVFATVEMS